MGKWIRRFFALVMLAVLAANAGAAWLAYDYNRAGPLTEAKSLIFPPRFGFQNIVNQLEEQGIIRNGMAVKLIAVGLQKAHRFKAGEYLFPPEITAHQVIDMIVDGKVVMRKVTLPEGLTSREAATILLAEPALSGGLPPKIEEGTLLPETYLFTYGDDRTEMAKQMQRAMTQFIDRTWEQRSANLPIRSKQQAITLASIVEKETGVASERPLVASVFINRLNRGMRLQSDPTVVYGIYAAHGIPSRKPITVDDLKRETPYNTYVIDGLPPGPIANPGKASIEAVLNPPQTDFLYFVATGTGGHRFAKTLDEHNNNVRQYRETLAKKQP